jgi:ribonuclease HII
MISKILGIDEAGRGAVVGPLVIAGFAIEKGKESELKKIGVKDSKLLSPAKRERLAKKLEKIGQIVIQKIGPCKIDNYRKSGINLNQIEAMKMADIINFIKPDAAYIDSPDPKPENFGQFVKKIVREKVNIFSANFAESKWPVVAAASIIAKVNRDEEIEKLKKKYGLRGSGYPADPETEAWLKQWKASGKKWPECVRQTWETIQQLEKSKQKGLLAWLRKK